MAFDQIGLGIVADDGNGDKARIGGQRINAVIGAANAGQFQGFKNRVRNGDFCVAQRGTSFASPSNGAYTLDGWINISTASMTVTISRQDFAPGQADVPDAPDHYLRWAMTGTASGNPWIEQRIENVRALAGQTCVLSFWAKASRTENLVARVQQNFGSGGSTPAVTAIQKNDNALDTSWAHKTLQFTMPSISGKTIGTSSYLALQFYFLSGISAITVELADVQIEPADSTTPKASAFERLPIGVQLAQCQRFYVAKSVRTENGSRHIPLPPMRAAPSVTSSNGSAGNVTADGFELTNTGAATSNITASAEL
jgi:hypothetical protein